MKLENRSVKIELEIISGKRKHIAADSKLPNHKIKNNNRRFVNI